ncbi:MAG: PKD domain-containing protein [Thermoplasmata archaeon]|nr:PKD domain-containing protein [Thermoplasmata archaeon]MCI4359394.1 PKD domain-containing protein [Thermoplasmata archaeon]
MRIHSADLRFQMRRRMSHWSRPGRIRIVSARVALSVLFAAMLAFSVYGTLSPPPLRCGLPGSVGCSGGLLGPALVPASSGEQWFTVTLFDYGFWIVDSTTGANESTAWNVFEGWTVHVNATSLAPDAAVGGTAYHGLGVELNQTGQQLLSLAAPVGAWTPGSFVAPLAEYHHQHIWCTIQCGPGHGGQQAWVLNVIPSVPLPKATATSNLTSGRAPLAVTFTGTPSAGTPPYNTSWDFGDGTAIGYGVSAGHTYALGGAYEAQFRVTDAKGMGATASVGILVNSSDPLRASVSAAPTLGAAPFTSTLSLIVHGGAPPYTYAWSFGDGSTGSAGNHTSHLYAAPGVYAVVATVTDSHASSVRILTSIIASPPLGYFPVTVIANPPNGSAPIIIQMSATPLGGTAPYRYLWVFGDGSTGSGASSAHQYNLTGSYEVNLFVSDSAGHVGSAAVNLPLVAASGGGGGGDERPAGGPLASPAAVNGTLTIFPLATPRDGGSPLLVNASASIEAGTGLGETISWNFGDGTTGSGTQVSHQFARVGAYNVTVTATDSGGNQGSNRTVVRVEPLSMTLVANRSLGDPPISVTTAVSIVGGTGRFGVVSWNWGDGNTSFGNLVNRTYGPNETGPIVIRASTTDSLGTLVNASITLQVNPVLVATVNVRHPSSVLPPVNVDFTLDTRGGSGSYNALPLWDFGDGTSTRSGNVTNHSYSKLGDYRIVVRTNDSLGSSVVASAWLNLTVAPPTQPVKLGGKPPWSLTGVSDPNRAALILIGIVAATGLLLLQQRRRRSKAKPTTRPNPRPGPGATARSASPPSVARPASRPVTAIGAKPGAVPPPSKAVK